MKFITYIMIVMVSLGVFTASWAEETDWKKGVWEHLFQYVGTYNYDAVLDDPEVKKQLIELLGKAELEHLKKNLEVKGPIGFVDDCLVLWGNGRHQGGEEHGQVSVCIYKGKVHAAMRTGGQLVIYSREPKFEWLPGATKLWAYREAYHDKQGRGEPDGIILKTIE